MRKKKMKRYHQKMKAERIANLLHMGFVKTTGKLINSLSNRYYQLRFSSGKSQWFDIVGDIALVFEEGEATFFVRKELMSD